MNVIVYALLSVWNETADFSLTTLQSGPVSIAVDLFDEDTFSDDKLGFVHISVDDMRVHRQDRQWYTVLDPEENDSSAGEVELILDFVCAVTPIT